MADEVKIPVSLEITDLDTSQITAGTVSKRLSGVKKAVSSVFNSVSGSKLGQSVSKFSQTVSKTIGPAKELLKASKQMTAEEEKAAKAAWKHSDAYRQAVAHNKKLDKRIQDIQNSWEEFGIGKSPVTDVAFQEEINKLEGMKVSTDMPEQETPITRLKEKIEALKNEMTELSEQYKANQEAFQRNQEKFDKYQENIEKTKELLELEKQRSAELKKQSKENRSTYRKQVDPAKKEAALGTWNATKQQLAESEAAIARYEAKLNNVDSVTNKFNASQQSLADDAGNIKSKFTELGEELKNAQQKLFGLQAASGTINIFSKIGNSIKDVISKIRQMKKTSNSSSGSMSKSFKKLRKNILMFGFGFRSVYYLIKRLRNIIKDDFGVMAASFDEINEPLSKLMMSFNRLKGSLATALQPIISAIIPALTKLIDYLSATADKVGEFFAVLTGQEYIYKAKANQKDFASTINGTDKLADYDQLKVIGQDDKTGVEYEKTAVATADVAESHGELLDNLASLKDTLKEIWGLISPIFEQLAPFAERLANILLPAINEVLVAVEPLISTLAVALEPIGDMLILFINMILPVLVGLIQIIIPIINQIIQTVLPILQRMLTALQPLFDSIVDKVLPFIADLLDAILPLIISIMECAADLLEPILQLLGPLMDLVIIILQPILDLCKPLIKILSSLVSAIGKILGPIIALLSPLIELINAILEPIIASLMMIVGPIMDALGDVISWSVNMSSFIVNKVLNVIVKGLQWLVDKVKIVSTVFTTVFNKVRDVIKGAWDFIKGIINTILGGIETLVNGVIKGVNLVIDALNLLSFDVPDWVPVIGGETFGFDIPNLKAVNIPRLAQGAVLPPNREFLATLGDQRHGTNIEAPLETIKQALIEALQEAGGSNKPIILTLDGKTVAQVVWDESEKRYKQTGKLAYSY